MMQPTSSFVVCVDNGGYVASLESRKIYHRLPDGLAERDGLMRVVDESGEDYLYPARLFVPIAVPEAVEKAFAAVA